MNLEQRLEGMRRAVDDIAQSAASNGDAGRYHSLMFKLVNDSKLPYAQQLVRYYFAAFHGYKEENRQG